MNSTIFRVINGYTDSFSALSELISGDDNKYIVLYNDYKFYEDYDIEFINGIKIDDNIIIDGAGHTIDGFNLARVFDVNGSNVTIKNINFINCYNSDEGGAISLNGANSSVIDCNFTNSTANNGGAIYIFNCGDFNVSACRFVNSTANKGSVIYVIADSCLNITDSTCIPVSGDDIAAIYVDSGGYILSDIDIIILNGKDKYVIYGHVFNITATVSTSGMSVAGGIVNLTVNNTVLEASDVNGVYSAEYLVDFYGTKVVSATYLNVKGNQELIEYNLISKYSDIEVNASGVYDDCIIGSINTTYDGVISFEIAGKTISANVTDGNYILDISSSGIDAKTYIDVPVIFISHDNEFEVFTLINLTIKPKTVNVIAYIYNSASGVDLRGVLVAEGKIGNVITNIGGKIYEGVMSEDGNFVLIGTKSLDYGDYNDIVLNFVSNDGNYAGNTTVNFTIVKAPTIDDITVSGNYSQTISFNMAIYNATDGDLIVLHLPDGTNTTGAINGDLVEFTVKLPFACNCSTPVFYVKNGVSYDIAHVTWNINKITTNIGFNVTNITSKCGENNTVEVTVHDA